MNNQIRAASVGLFFIIFAVLFCRYLLIDIENFGILDWDQHFFYHEVPRKTILEYHQFPLWNPYYNGGNVMLANPQSRILQPFILLNLVFGVVVGLKIEIVLHLFFGLWGCYQLLRCLDASTPAAVFGAVVACANGVFALQLTVGHTWYLSQAWAPWVLLCYLKYLRDISPIWPSALFIALMFMQGGIYPVPHIILFVFLFSSLEAVRTRTARPIFCFFKIISIAAGFISIRLLPMLEFMWVFPRLVDSDLSINLSTLLKALTEPSFEKLQLHSYTVNIAAWEYGAFIGWMPLLIGLGAMAILLWRRQYRDAGITSITLTGMAFLFLAFGASFSYAPWSILHMFPIFSSHHIPTRFLAGFLLAFGIAVALGADGLSTAIKHRFTIRYDKRSGNGKHAGTIRHALLICLMVAVSYSIMEIAMVNASYFSLAFPSRPDEPKKAATFTQVKGDPYKMYPAAIANMGTIDAYEPVSFGPHAIPKGSPDYRGEHFLEKESGKLTLLQWSPNKIIIKVSTDTGDNLIVNQNYATGWKTETGLMVDSFNGLIRVPVPPGDRVVSLYYRPASFVMGGFISMFTMIGVIAYSICLKCTAHRNRRRSGEIDFCRGDCRS